MPRKLKNQYHIYLFSQAHLSLLDMPALTKLHCGKTFQVLADFCSKIHDQVKHALQTIHNHQMQQSQLTFFQHKTAVVAFGNNIDDFHSQTNSHQFF